MARSVESALLVVIIDFTRLLIKTRLNCYCKTRNGPVHSYISKKTSEGGITVTAR